MNIFNRRCIKSQVKAFGFTYLIHQLDMGGDQRASMQWFLRAMPENLDNFGYLEFIINKVTTIKILIKNNEK
jgi:hypothetical protein